MPTRYSRKYLSEIISRIQTAYSRPFILLIDGPDAAGKSTLASEIKDEFVGSAAVIHGDDFYADLDPSLRESLSAEQGAQQYFDWQRLRNQVLEPARAGKPIAYQRFDWIKDQLGDWTTVDEPDLLIVEGVYSSRPELRGLADLVVWVTTSPDQRLRRQIARAENSEEWISKWRAAFDYYAAHVRGSVPGEIVVIGE